MHVVIAASDCCSAVHVVVLHGSTCVREPLERERHKNEGEKHKLEIQQVGDTKKTRKKKRQNHKEPKLWMQGEREEAPEYFLSVDEATIRFADTFIGSS